MDRELKTLDDRLADLEPDEDVALDDALSQDVLSQYREAPLRGTSPTTLSAARSFSCSSAGLRSTPPLPDRGPKQVRVVIDYRFPTMSATRTVIAASHGYNLRRILAV